MKFLKTVKPLDDFKLMVDFTTGERKIYDIKPLYSLPVFSELKNKSLFESFHIGSTTLNGRTEQILLPILYLLKVEQRHKS